MLEAVRTHLTALLTLPGLCLGEAVRVLELAHPQGYGEATARLAARQSDPKCGKEYRKVLQSLLLPPTPSQAPCFTQLLHPDDSVRVAAVKTYLGRLARGVVSAGGSSISR